MAETGGNASGSREVLFREKARTLESLGVKFDTVALLGRISEEDQGQVWHDEYISLRLNSLDYEKLRLIDQALERLETGEYGICLECDERIGPKRLRAIPWARYCIACQDRIYSDVSDR